VVPAFLPQRQGMADEKILKIFERVEKPFALILTIRRKIYPEGFPFRPSAMQRSFF
jgi:hypothetical protein